MWQKVRQVLRVVIVVLMDVSQEVKGQFAEVNTRQFATFHHRIHDSRLFRCIVVSTEHIVLSAYILMNVRTYVRVIIIF